MALKLITFTLPLLDSSSDCVSTGDFVLLGPFDSSLMVGFYIVSNGWCGGTDKLYTVNTFNNGSKVLSTVFYHYSSHTVIIGMEDLPGSRFGDDLQDVVFQVDTDPQLVPADFYGDIPFICDLDCDNCNYTSGNCIYYRRRNFGTGIILAVAFGLAFFLIIAVGIIIYLIRIKNVGRGVLPNGWYPVSNSLADQLQLEDSKQEELDSDDEENL